MFSMPSCNLSDKVSTLFWARVYVSKVKTESSKICDNSEEETLRGWIPPAEIELNCCKKLYTVIIIIIIIIY